MFILELYTQAHNNTETYVNYTKSLNCYGNDFYWWYGSKTCRQHQYVNKQAGLLQNTFCISFTSDLDTWHKQATTQYMTLLPAKWEEVAVFVEEY